MGGLSVMVWNYKLEVLTKLDRYGLGKLQC